MLSRIISRTRVLPRTYLVSSQFTRQYHDVVIDHYENPRNVGSLSKSDTNVGTGLVGAPACGDVMKLQVCELLASPHSLHEPSPSLRLQRLNLEHWHTAATCSQTPNFTIRILASLTIAVYPHMLLSSHCYRCCYYSPSDSCQRCWRSWGSCIQDFWLWLCYCI